MADIKDYGELYTSDILVVGGGMAGLVTAIRAKENDPTLDILVIDKGIIGWNGQATKAGNGIRSTSKNSSGSGAFSPMVSTRQTYSQMISAQ